MEFKDNSLWDGDYQLAHIGPVYAGPNKGKVEMHIFSSEADRHPNGVVWNDPCMVINFYDSLAEAKEALFEMFDTDEETCTKWLKKHV